MQLASEEGNLLVKLARRAVEEYLRSGRIIDPPEDLPKELMERCGVFVTLNSFRHGKRELRGCIGFPYPTDPLARAVIESAINSATQDPRFLPISIEELDQIIFEISVLTPPQLIRVEKPQDYPSEIEIGQDGLIVERGYHKGLLLPQVPVEWGWDVEEFLCHSCQKAGLPPDCWLTKGTRIHKFGCVIAQETTPGGKVALKNTRDPH
ncbi:MAG: TIGR00296 family protein [Candidatus Bathyarchaeota archaeon]|nr:MAG: TIGR00296 family protein [Candidatus Bathyarchaeota archaeon]